MGLNNAEIKKANRNSIYRYLLKSDVVSKNEVALGLELTAPTVTSALNDLKRLGLVREEGAMDSNGGRKSMGYSCDKAAKYAIGVNIAKNYIDLAIVDMTMRPVYTNHEKKQLKGKAESYEWLKKFISEAITEAEIADEKILGIGYALPAITDETGTKIFGLHEEMDLPHSFYEVINNWFAYPALLRREAICAGFAVVNNLHIDDITVYLNLSPSIGGAIIYNDAQANQGINCRAGEFGHLTLVPKGRRCFCGRKGCMNAYCSTEILTSLTDGDLSLFFERLRAGEEEYCKIWNEYTDYLALSIHDLMTSFDEKIVLGGDLARYLPPYMDDIEKKVQEYDPYLKDVSYLSCGSLEFDAASIGAAGYFIEDYISNI